MLENVFSNGPVYGEKWNEVSRRKFNEKEVSSVRSATVVDSKYGKSVCFFMASGGMQFIPLSNKNENTPIGTDVDVKSAEIVELSRSGDNNILRIEI